MTTKDLIRAELDNLREEDLQLLYGLIRRMRTPADASDAEDDDILGRLGEIKIDGPADFSTNHDYYITRHKRGESDLS